MDYVNLARILDAISLIIAAGVMVGAGIGLHVDITRNKRNGVSGALRNLIYASAALIGVSAALTVASVFGDGQNNLVVEFVLLVIRIAVLAMMAGGAYLLAVAITRSEQ